MYTTPTPVYEMYRKLGVCLELFLTTNDPHESEFWECRINILLRALSHHTGTLLSREEFTRQWFEAEFGDRL